MKKDYVFSVWAGGRRKYGFTATLPEEVGGQLVKAEQMEITCDGTLEYVGPGWVMDLGLGRPWCFCFDLLMFRNPWRER